MTYVGLKFLLNTGIRFHDSHTYILKSLDLRGAQIAPPPKKKKQKKIFFFKQLE